MNHLELLAIQVHEVISNAVAMHFWKIPICFFLAGVAFLFGVENQSIISGLTVLVAFDLLMGIIASYKEGEPITSRKALKTGTKFAVYLMLCSASYVTEGIIPGTTLVDQAMVSFLAITEFVSIQENAARMGFRVPQKMLNQLKTYSENTFSKV